MLVMFMRRVLRKAIVFLLLAAVLFLSYLAAFFVISLTPYGHYIVRAYSIPETALSPVNSSSLSGAWSYQMLLLGPAPGSVNVPRDSSIVIVGLRPERVENVSLSPQASIARDEFTVYSGAGPSSVQRVYPTDLLQPNTTYNVSAIVAGIQSLWTFSTSTQPTHLTFSSPLSPSNWWVALVIAMIVTVITSIAAKNRLLRFVNNG